MKEIETLCNMYCTRSCYVSVLCLLYVYGKAKKKYLNLNESNGKQQTSELDTGNKTDENWKITTIISNDVNREKSNSDKRNNVWSRK